MSDSLDAEEVSRRMAGAVSSLRDELSSLRGGRASPSMVESLSVEAYGGRSPLKQLAAVSAPEPRLLSIQVWDPTLVTSVEKAIADSELNLNPSTEGQVIRLRIPELTGDRRKELIRVARQYAESARVAVRNVRRDALDRAKRLEKDGDIGQDDSKSWSSRVQELTDSSVSEIDDALSRREKEIESV